MIECSGVCYFKGAEAVTGRLCQSGKPVSRDTAQILLWNGKDELSEAMLSSAVGVVFPNDLGESAIEKASRLAEFCRLPALGVNFSPALANDSIAILDSAHSKLYVNPDLETINCYFGAHTRQAKRNTNTLLETSGTVRVADTTHCGLVAGRTHELDEQKYYEYLCELADTNTGAELVACANACDSDRFISDTRAIYRAGVWGKFSLLCTCVCTPEHADELVMLLHKVFCMLEDEGREFNGFIPKGILVDTPLLLLSKPKHSVIDFFCLDFERLRKGLSASQDPRVGETDTARYIEEFAKKARGARISLRGTDNARPNVLSELLETVAPHRIYK
ncbi:MAG: hypothetical protein E7653_05100 [Ruminococcaceae bacterium]|nr:hypothetical protein [Oscillospiraceae bacterium]